MPEPLEPILPYARPSGLHVDRSRFKKVFAWISLSWLGVALICDILMNNEWLFYGHQYADWFFVLAIPNCLAIGTAFAIAGRWRFKHPLGGLALLGCLGGWLWLAAAVVRFLLESHC